jgi:hypothetical protein
VWPSRHFIGAITVTDPASLEEVTKVEFDGRFQDLLVVQDEDRDGYDDGLGFFARASYGQDGLDIDLNVPGGPAYLKFNLGIAGTDPEAMGDRIFIGAPFANGGRYHAHSGNFQFQVPEPSSISLFLFGATCMLGLAWRRRRS